MAMRPQLYGISALAVELGHVARTVARALRDVPAEGKKGRHPAWTMRTAVDALNSHLGASNQFHTWRVSGMSLPGPSPMPAGAIDAIVSANESVERFLRRLRATPTAEARRKILASEGRIVGALERAFTAALAADEYAILHQPFVDQVLHDLVGEIVRLCELKIVDGEEAAQG